MKALWVLLWFMLAAQAGAQSSNPILVAPVPDPARAGQELAARLRSLAPSRDSEFRGSLLITDGDRTTQVPILSRVTVGPTNWQVAYVATPLEPRPAETLVIFHAPDRPNRYQLATGGSGEPRPLAPGELSRPFAGSDFWVMDLGLEFFHWPGQRIVKSEMRRSRACRVLESTPAASAGQAYARVLSWVDVDTDGILRAEAYDASGRMVKEFLLGSLRKVDGQRQLESMKMRLPGTDRQTELKFDLSQGPEADLGED